MVTITMSSIFTTFQLIETGVILSKSGTDVFRIIRVKPRKYKPGRAPKKSLDSLYNFYGGKMKLVGSRDYEAITIEFYKSLEDRVSSIKSIYELKLVKQ